MTRCNPRPFSTDPALLALPGLGLDEEAWRPTLAHYGGPAGVLRIPGYGARADRRADLSPSALAREVVSSYALSGPVVVLGHSASCQVAAHVAALDRARVVGLVLIGPTTQPTASSWPRMAKQWLRTAGSEPKRQALSLVRQYRRTGLGTMRRAMDQARRDRIDQTMRRVQVPALIIRGPDDQICGETWAQWLAGVPRDGGNTSVVTLPAGGHMVPLTQGPLVAGALRAFVATLRPDGS
jgi:pimeloyl-ACP methyl ester carboxylesterase